MSLQLWLPFNGSLKNQGLLNVATPTTSVTYGDGKIGEKGLKSSTKVSYDISSANISTHQLSFSFWAKCDVYTGTSTAWWQLCSFKCSDATQFHVYCVSNARYKIEYNPELNNFCDTTLWHHLTYILNGTKLTVYTDGIQTAQANVTNVDRMISSMSFGVNTVCINDFRLYDHILSQHEIERDYCSLLIHYPLRDPYIEDTTNLLSYPTPETPVAANIGWDTTLHPNAINVSGWGNGWNGGVTAAATTQHAYWNVIDNIPTMIMKDDGQIGWIGITSLTSVPLINAIGAGGKYTISFEAKSNVKGKQMHTGLHYTNSSGKAGFYDGSPTVNLTTDWETYSFTFTLGTDANLSKGGRVYVYGHTGSKAGTVYVRNYQLEAKDHATPYAASPRSNEPVYDCSGRGYHSVDRGELIVKPNTPRNSYYTYFTPNNAIKIPSPYGTSTKNIDEFSFAMWINLVDGGAYKTIFTTSYGENSSANAGWFSLNTENQKLWFYNKKYHGISGTFPTNEWHHIVLTYKNSAAQWYLDGEPIGDPIADDIGYISMLSHFSLGDSYKGSSWSGADFEGAISDFRFYGIAIPASAVQDLYNNSATIDNQGNIHCFEFVEV